MGTRTLLYTTTTRIHLVTLQQSQTTSQTQHSRYKVTIVLSCDTVLVFCNQIMFNSCKFSFDSGPFGSSVSIKSSAKLKFPYFPE